MTLCSSEMNVNITNKFESNCDKQPLLCFILKLIKHSNYLKTEFANIDRGIKKYILLCLVFTISWSVLK